MRARIKQLCLSFVCAIAPIVLVLAGLDVAQGAGALSRITIASSSNRDSRLPSVNGMGNKIVFQSDSDFLGQNILAGQNEIWLYDTTTMTLTRVTTASGSDRDSSRPRLSDDGTKITFYGDSDFLGQGIPFFQFEVWLYDTSTMTVTRITTASDSSRTSFDPDLNANGTKIAFMSDSDFLGQGISFGQYEIWLYDAATLTVTRITTASGPSRFSWDPSINSNGTKIVFYSDSDFLSQGIPAGQNEIWLYDTTQMSLTRVTTASASNRSSFGPQLSFDGSKIVFYSDSDFLGQGIPDQQFEIWLFDTATKSLTRLTTASPSGRWSQVPQINADGTKIVFQSESDFRNQGIADNQFEIWLYDTATLTVTRITSASDSARRSQVPSLSAIGNIIAFQSESDFLGQGIFDEQYEIWLFGEPAHSVYLPVVIRAGP